MPIDPANPLRDACRLCPWPPRRQKPGGGHLGRLRQCADASRNGEFGASTPQFVIGDLSHTVCAARSALWPSGRSALREFRRRSWATELDALALKALMLPSGPGNESLLDDVLTSLSANVIRPVANPEAVEEDGQAEHRRAM